MKTNRLVRAASIALIALLTASTIAGCATENGGQSASSSDADRTLVSQDPDNDAEARDEAAYVSEFFPENGAQIEGFTLREVRPFPLIDAEVALFEHDKTGASLMYIHNDDVNRVFELSFRTIPTDNTGLPHVFEHATLSGSEKYPSQSLFFNLSYQTYQTFMNAFTMDRMTSYPLASLSEAQLLALADYYVDSCFHPMIMEDESIYRREAWRYRLEDKDDPLTIEGTVYSEMLGAMTRTAWATLNALRTAFPGSTIGNEYGGDPAYIPDMTYEALKNYHDLYYHPSNCIASLYGDIEDYAAFFKLLDAEFSQYEKKEFTFADDGYEPIDEAVRAEYVVAAEEGASTENTAVVYYGFVCPELTAEEQIQMDYMLSLLNEDASELSAAMKEKLPTGSFSCVRETAGPEPLVLFAIENIEKDDADVFTGLIDDALAKMMEEGFPDDLVDSVMARTALANKLTREDSSIGVDLATSVAYAYIVTDDPWFALKSLDAVDEMASWNANGDFQTLAKKCFEDNARTAIAITCPEAGLLEKENEALAEKLADVKAAMSDEEIEALIAQTKSDDDKEETLETQDDATANYVKDLTAVTVDELPEEYKEYEVTDETDDEGIRRLNAVAGVDGAGMTQIFLDASHLEMDDLHPLKLWLELEGYLDTTAHTSAELETLKTRYLYNFSLGAAAIEDAESVTPYASASWIMDANDMDDAYDLVYEILFDRKLDDVDALKAGISSIRTDLRTSINNNAYAYQVYRALSLYGERMARQSYMTGIDYYLFLEETERLLESDPDGVVASLESVRDKMKNRYGAVSFFASDADGIEKNKAASDAFLQRLEYEETTPATYTLPKPATEEAIVVESPVQFNGMYAGFEEMELDGYSGALDVLASIVSDQILYPELRDRYGAYGVMHDFLDQAGMYIVSYRDPNIEETFRVYIDLTDKVRALELDQDTINGYILSTYAMYAMPDGELSGAMSALSSVAVGEAQDRVLEVMREIKSVTWDTIDELAGVYDLAVENGAISTSGGAAKIEAIGELYETILNPFGAEAASYEDFADVPADHPLYDYVMGAVEYGMMSPVDDATFGVDEDATIGEFVYALAQAGGMSADAEEAIVLFRQYGVLSAEIQADDPLTRAQIERIANAMAGGETDVDWNEYVSGDVVTRGELARILMEE